VLYRFACSLRSYELPFNTALMLMKDAWNRCEQPPVTKTRYEWDTAVSKLKAAYGRYDSGRSDEYVSRGHTQQGDPDEPDWGSRWVDLRLYLEGTCVRPDPIVGGARDDEIQLLYPKRWHTNIALTGAGKTAFALWHVKSVLDAGGHVVYLHFEEPEPDGIIDCVDRVSEPGPVLSCPIEVLSTSSTRAADSQEPASERRPPGSRSDRNIPCSEGVVVTARTRAPPCGTGSP
jgi:hypothetical protein